MSFVAVPLLALAATGSAGFAGMVASVGALARLLAGGVAGVYVDRNDPHRIMVAASSVAAVVTGTLAIGVLADFGIEYLLVTLAAIEGVAAVFFAPAEDVLVRDVVAPDELPTAYSWSEAAVWATGLAGPVVGAALFSWGQAAPFAVNAVSYLVAVTLLSRSFDRPQRAPVEKATHSRPTASNYVLGFRLLRSDQLMRFAIVQIPLHNVVLGAVTIYTIVRLQDQEQAEVLIGVVLAAQGAGALVGSTFSAAAIRRFGPGRMLLANGTIWSLLVPVICVLQNPIALSLAFLVLWLVAPSQRAGLVSYQATVMPPEHLGKVRSSAGVLVQLASTIGPLLGALAVGFTPPATALLLGAITVSPVVASFLSPGVRNARIPSTLGATAQAQA